MFSYLISYARVIHFIFIFIFLYSQMATSQEAPTEQLEACSIRKYYAK